MNKENSVIRRFALNSYGEHRIILVLQAFWDDSGNYSDPKEEVVVLGGLVAPLESMTRFEDEWKAVLKRFKVPYLHMREYAHSVKGSPFAKWKKDEAKRKNFMRQLLNVIDDNIVSVGGAAIPKSDFEQNEAVRDYLIDPYYPCFILCLNNAASQCLEEGENENVEFVFSEQPGLKGKALEIWYKCRMHLTLRDRLASISFASYKTLPQLQAADLVAYELRLFVQRKIYLETIEDPMTHQNPDLRHPMRRFLNGTPERSWFYIYHNANLLDLHSEIKEIWEGEF